MSRALALAAASSEDREECSICLDSLGENNTCITACGHRFHLECMLQLRSNPVIRCPLCRVEVHSRYQSSQEDRELLRVVTKRQWERMRELRSQEDPPQFRAAIEEGDYINGANVGMMALHFAVRDHAPLEVIRDIYDAYPKGLYVEEVNGLSPIELLATTTPNGPNYTPEQYAEVKAFLESL